MVILIKQLNWLILLKAGADAVKFQLFDIDEQISPIAKNAKYQLNATGERTWQKWHKVIFTMG